MQRDRRPRDEGDGEDADQPERRQEEEAGADREQREVRRVFGLACQRQDGGGGDHCHACDDGGEGRPEPAVGLPAAERDRQGHENRGRARVHRDDGRADAGIEHRDVAERKHDVEQREPDGDRSDSCEHGRIQTCLQIGIDHGPDDDNRFPRIPGWRSGSGSPLQAQSRQTGALS